jgi:ribosomal-protein-alanine N-acetyltransferase
LCFGRDSWPWLELLAALTIPGTIRLRADVDGRAVGFAIGDRRSGSELGWVASLGVHPDHRRHGIGRQLLGACEAALGTRRVRLTLRASNAAALSLYRQAGYQQVDLWRKYYRDGEDGIVMERAP